MKEKIKVFCDRVNFPLALVVWPLVFANINKNSLPIWLLIVIFILAIPGIIRSFRLWMRSVHFSFKWDN